MAAYNVVTNTTFSLVIYLKLNLPTLTLNDLDCDKNLTEEQGDTLLVGRRQMTSSGHVLYHVGVSARNASSGFSGHYQCVVERQHDRL